MSPEERSRATAAWFAPQRWGNLTAGTMDDAFVEGVRHIRDSLRATEGGGGMCHLVTEVLQSFGFGRQARVTYLTGDGEICCPTHLVLVLGDGTILDPTADQFGEGHDVRVVPVGDVDQGRYRPEFHDDYHPGHPDAGSELDAWKGDWTGETDDEAHDRLADERGGHWWSTDLPQLADYLERQVAHAAAKGGEDSWEGRFRDEAAEVRARMTPRPGPKPG